MHPGLPGAASGGALTAHTRVCRIHMVVPTVSTLRTAGRATVAWRAIAAAAATPATFCANFTGAETCSRAWEKEQEHQSHPNCRHITAHEDRRSRGFWLNLDAEGAPHRIVLRASLRGERSGPAGAPAARCRRVRACELLLAEGLHRCVSRGVCVAARERASQCGGLV